MDGASRIRNERAAALDQAPELGVGSSSANWTKGPRQPNTIPEVWYSRRTEEVRFISRSLSSGTSNPCFGQLASRTYDCKICATRQLPSLSAGVSPKIVSEQLGHASVAFTLEVYLHDPHMQDTAA